MKVCKEIFYKVADPESLFQAWDEFRKGKGNKSDVLSFEYDLEAHIFSLARDLHRGAYKH